MVACTTAAGVVPTTMAAPADPPTTTCSRVVAPPHLCAVDINASRTFRRFPQPDIIPWPRNISARAAYTTLSNHSLILAQGAAVAPLARLLSTEIAALTGLNLSVLVAGTGNRPPPPPSLPRHKKSAVNTIALAIGAEQPYSFVKVSSSSGVILKGATYQGLAAATTTLLQSLEHSGDDDGGGPFNCSAAPVWRVPHITIYDRPEFEYRGLMVDAARHAVPLAVLKQFVQLCRFYKLNYLHLHLTVRPNLRLKLKCLSLAPCLLQDDQSFTFPSAAFPELSSKSANGFAYSRAQLRELSAFAALCGVTCVGEMDVPGHSGSMIHALPGLFGFSSAPKLGIVNFGDAAVITRLHTLFDEIDEIFPSPCVAIGGDEVVSQMTASLKIKRNRGGARVGR
jgi:hexosaminidase